MKKKKDIRYQLLYRLLYVMLLVGICIFGGGKLVGIDEPVIWQVLIAVTFAGLLCSFSFINIRGRILCVVALVGCVIITFLLVDRNLMTAFWSSYTDWIVNGCARDAEWSIWYGCVQAVYVSVGCYVFWLMAERFFILKKILAGAIGIALIVCLFCKEPISHSGVTCMLWYLLLIYIETIQEKWQKVQKHDIKRYMLWLLPFCVGYFLLSCFMPAPEEPFDWAFVKNAYYQVKETAIECYRNLTRGEKEDFGLAVSGFSEDGTLGSGLIDSNRILLEINGKGNLVTNIYLTGKIYDSFDGREWTEEATGDTDDRFLDAMETLYAVERYNSENSRDYLYDTKLEVAYRYLDTGYMFLPLKAWKIEGDEWTTEGSNIVFGEQRGYGTEYKTLYYQINVDHPAFYEMMEVPKEPDEELWNSLIRRQTPVDKHEYATLEDLEEHREYIYANYKGNPVISEEVRAYLDEITAGAETDIDKLRAIEAELSSYTYTKQPGKLPEQVVDENSYLEYFLLESKQGYCSYFATAFVLLARAEGLPARYVEGFCVPVNEEKHMTVYANMAHAWPEVYLDEVGWIPFEPTPGYEEIRYTPWELGSKTGTWDSSAFITEDISETQWNVSEAQDVEKANKQRKIILWGSICVLLSFLLIFVIDNIVKQYRYIHMSTDEQFYVEVRKNLWVLSRLSLIRTDSETIHEFMDRVQNNLSEKMDCSFTFLEIYEEVLYGSREITANMLQCVKSERIDCMEWVKNHKRVDYYFMRLRLSYFGRWW